MPRPPSEFHGFVGQRKVVERLRRQMAGARSLGEVCPHILLIGQSGIGKTELATALARELRTNLLSICGRVAVSDIASKLREAQVGDVVFIDEAHGLDTRSQELLFEVLDHWRLPAWVLPSPTPAGPAVGNITPPDKSPDIARVTLILATDQPGHLLNALIKRFDLVENLEPYPKRELRAIVDRVATDLKLLLSPQARNQIAGVAHGLPRVARQLLRNLRRHHADQRMGELSIEDVRQFLKNVGIDRLGLTPEHRKVLRYLGAVGKAGLEQLARQLGTDADYVQRFFEPQLLGLNLIRISTGGRTLTPSGEQWLAEQNRKNEHVPRKPETIG